MNIKCIVLSERRQSQQALYYMIPFTGHSEKGKTTGTENTSIVARVETEGGFDYKGMQGSLGGDGTISYHDGVSRSNESASVNSLYTKTGEFYCI